MLRRGRAATSSERRQPGRRQANKPCVLTRTGATLCPDAEPGPFLKAAAHRGGPWADDAHSPRPEPPQCRSFNPLC